MPRDTSLGSICASGLLALLLAGCGSPVPEDPEAARAAEEKERLDQLRALGYIGFSEDKVVPGEFGVVTHDRERAWKGYNLFTVRRLSRTDLVDMEGRLINSWSDPEDKSWARSVLLPDGDLLVVVPKRALQRLAWNGEVVWRRRLNAHHDVAATAAGPWLVLLEKRLRRPDGSKVRDNEICVVSPAGEPEGRLSLLDVMGSRPEYFHLDRVAGKKDKETDPLHANSLQWIDRPDLAGQHPIYETGNILVSIRHQDTIAVVNWRRRELVWVWGRGEIIGPHDATLLESGNILVFDNGLGREWSRVLELDPRSGEIVWEYRAPEPETFYTTSHGAAQRLPNGSTLITDSNSGRAFELTPEGEIVWEYFSPHTNDTGHRATINRLYRYDEAMVRRILERVASAPPA